MNNLELTLKEAVNNFTKEMEKRLLKKQEQGWKGWDDSSIALDLSKRLLTKANIIKYAVEDKNKLIEFKKQCVDIANFAMMLHNIGEKATE